MRCLTPLLLLSLLLVPGLPCGADWPQPGPRPDRIVDLDAVTYHVSPDGNDDHDGRTRETAFGTLQKAADVVEPGDKVLVTRGVYHQSMHIRKDGRPDAWISFVAEPGAEIRGSEVWADWEPVEGRASVYQMPAPRLLSGWQKPDTPLQNRLEQVFVNGRLLGQVSDPAMLKPRGTFYVDDEAGLIMVCLPGEGNPNEELTEVSTLTYAIAIGAPPNRNWWREERVGLENRASFIRIAGFRVRHIANFSRMAAIQVRGLCNNIIIEDCDVQWVNYNGIGAASLTMWDPEQQKWFFHHTSHVTIRHCISSNNGVQGMGGGGVSDIAFEYNILDNNNYRGMSPWFEGGAIKTGFDGERIIIRGNVARNNHNHGLWIDYGGPGSIIENNLVYNSIAGAILNEVTPTPGQRRLEGGETEALDPTAEEIRAIDTPGTIIRNNVLIGTRTPGGGGINISSSSDSPVYNNICFANDGGGINLGGSPDRRHTAGQKGNRIYANILDRNFHHATAVRAEDDRRGRTFDNLFHDSLFITHRADTPFRIGGRAAGPEEWQALNDGADSVYLAESIFRDPDRWDFTLTDPDLARQVGFDPDALRLDWSEFFIPEPTVERTRRALEYTPVDLSGVFNRALVDDVAGDGEGGWTDQGGNDMSGLPTGRRNLDGVEYVIGPQELGALLLDTSRVQPGGFRSTVEITVDEAFDEVYFLYTSAWTGEGEIARFIVRYEDGQEVTLPLVAGQQILDWWTDPTWQQHATLNDNGVTVAWQGPNREVATVTLYHLGWANPRPGVPISRVVVTNQGANRDTAFLLLAVSGARPRTAEGEERAFRVHFDGDVDAVDALGREVPAGGYTRAAFDAGAFVEGVREAAFVPAKPLYYAVPAGFPLEGEGTISVWLRADDWTTQERRAMHGRLDYTRIMTPFSAAGSPARYSAWAISFEIDKEDLTTLTLRATVSGQSVRHEVTNLITPGEWFHVAARWRPAADRPGHTLYELWLDGDLLDSRTVAGRPDLIGDRIYLGVPSNGGQPWRGAMDEFIVYRIALDDARLSELATAD